jgi:hypothetical protein
MLIHNKYKSPKYFFPWTSPLRVLKEVRPLRVLKEVRPDFGPLAQSAVIYFTPSGRGCASFKSRRQTRGRELVNKNFF